MKVITVPRRDLVPFLSFSSVSFFNLKVDLSSPAASLAVGFCRRTKMANNNKNYAEFRPWVKLSFYWSKASSCIKRLCGLAELRRRCTASRCVGVVPLCLTPEAKMFQTPSRRLTSRPSPVRVPHLKTPPAQFWRVGEKMSDSISVYYLCIFWISFCVFLCVPQTNTR